MHDFYGTSEGRCQVYGRDGEPHVCEFWYGEMRVMFQGATDNSILDSCMRVARLREVATIIRECPKHSSQSNDYVESLDSRIDGLCRTMNEVIEQNCGITSTVNDDIVTWIVRHAGLLATRFVLNHDGSSAHNLVLCHDYTSAVCRFG